MLDIAPDRALKQRHVRSEVSLLEAEARLDRAQQDIRIALGKVRQALGYPNQPQKLLGKWGASATAAKIRRIKGE